MHSYHHLPHTHGQQGPASWVPPKPEKAFRCWLAGFVNLSALSHEPTKTAPGPRPRRWKDSKHLKETGKCSFLQSGQQSRFIPTHFPSQDHSSQQRALCTSNRANGVYLQAQHRPVSHPASASVVKQRNSRRRSRAGPEGPRSENQAKFNGLDVVGMPRLQELEICIRSRSKNRCISACVHHHIHSHSQSIILRLQSVCENIAPRHRQLDTEYNGESWEYPS